jgi:HD-GYP domain-containing protein (c-di-GMP phosphodiesterase class II)
LANIHSNSSGIAMAIQKIIHQIEKLIDIGIALSAEKDIAKLLEKILLGAKAITNADGGSLFLTDGDMMTIKIFQSDGLGLFFNDCTSNFIDKPSVSLYLANGEPNLHNVVSYSYHEDKTVNIHDAYDTNLFDFSGTKEFDKQNQYRSKSFLAIPLKNHQSETIGVLQLINVIDSTTQEIVDFDPISQRFAEALASQAATVLTKQQLIGDLETMFESMIKLIATAIDEKSPYTGAHCRRVPALTMMLAEAAHNTDYGYLQDFQLTDADRYELTIAGWLHDCGKITSPEHVIDKATKLETIFDRIHLLETRFEILKRDQEIALLKQQLADHQGNEHLSIARQDQLQTSIARLNDDLAFIKHSNTGGEFMSQTDIQRLESLKAINWTLNNTDTPLLSDEELYNLSITKGTLTTEERQIINHHINATIAMLEAINFPSHLQKVTEYAGGHHERMDGKGYPNGLTREQMSIPARVMAIADIFEALTAKDRPYKKGKKLSEALAILKQMKADNHIDPDLYDAFITQKVYKTYADTFLDDEQIDMD